MEQTQDCPMCGETMRIKTREQIDYIPGQSQTVRTEIKEWICPDCDYFEEYEESKDEPSEQP
jgi:YgiT-type zinc finger domain-containing protein